MKITTYNPDGSVKEVREHPVQVPEYIKTYDPQNSFLKITEDDVDLLLYKKKDVDKDILYHKYRFLLNYDYNNYILSLANNSQEKKHEVNTNEDELDYFDHVLSLLFSLYRTPRSYPNTLPEEVKRLLNRPIWIDTISHRARKSKKHFLPRHEVSEQDITNNLINTIHRFFYTLKKANELGHLDKNEQKVMHSLYPFANLHSSKLVNTNIFDNHNVVTKMIQSMYRTKEQSREALYTLAYTIESSVHSKSTNIHTASNKYLSMMTINSGSGNEEILQANPANRIEIKKIELPKEEIVCVIRNEDVSSDILAYFEETFKQEFDEYCKVGNDMQIAITNRQAIRFIQGNFNSILSPQQWKRFYYYYLDNIEEEYKKQNKTNSNLTSPYCYYYILVNLCNPGQRYEFKEDFLMSLINLALRRQCTNRCNLYEQMVRLNYIEESALLIPNENTAEPTSAVDKMELLRNELLLGDNSSIAHDLLHNSVKFKDVDDAINRILVFLSPLYSERYMIDASDASVKHFCGQLQKLLKEKEFESFIKNKNHQETDNTPEEDKRDFGFNVKLVLNIIGALSKGGGDKSPLRRRIAEPLKNDLKNLWHLRNAEGYNSYINKYDHNRGRKVYEMSYSYSLLNNDMINTIISYFN